MTNFTYTQIEEGFRWESDFLAIEFSSPSIQGFEDYTQLTSEKDIMYYYYTVRIFKKTTTWDDDDNEIVIWSLVTKRDTYDFPTIKQLKWLLEHQLQNNPVEGGQKIEYTSGAVRYQKVMATEGFICDDFYEITKSTDSEGKEEQYIFYCGTTFDGQGDLNSIGMRTPYVKRQDVENLLACVNAFINYSLEEHNKIATMWTSVIGVKGDKLYEYGISNEVVDNTIIESIYAPGDVLDIKTVVDNEEQDYQNVRITKIEENMVHLHTNEIIAGDTIVYVCNHPTEEMLTYKEQAIAKEFLSVLSEEERKEFRETSINELLSKYKGAIVDRTWMCREEHGFILDDQTIDRVEAVTPIVITVICLIKEYLTT